MSKKYITETGDTFSSISRAETGSEKNAQLIKQANPHATTPFTFGTVLDIPSRETQKGFNPYGLDIKVDGISVQSYDSFTHSSAVDGFSRVEFILPNEIQTRAIIPMLQPVAVDVGYNGQPLFSGFMETPVPISNDKGKRLKVSASSWANMIASPPPITAFPVEFKDTALDVVAETLIAPFMIEHLFYADSGPVFKKISMEQSDNVLDFLSGLTKQRALVLRDDEFGSVVFDNGELSGAPVLKIDADRRPDVTVSLSANASGWYSHVTGVLKSKRKRKRKKIVWKNPFYSGIMRNHGFEVSQIDEGELETAVNSVASRMFASAFVLSVTIPSWTDKNGNTIRPGTSIEIKSETNYIRDFNELLVDGVTLNGTPSAMVATMSCVIPGVYSGSIPEAVPWK